MTHPETMNDSQENTESQVAKCTKSLKRKVGGRYPKARGNRFERELVKFFQDSGIEAKRAYGSNGEALACHATVDVLAGGKRLQAKRRASIAAWLKVNEHQDAVVVREDRGETYVVLTLGEYADLVKGQEAKS